MKPHLKLFALIVPTVLFAQIAFSPCTGISAILPPVDDSIFHQATVTLTNAQVLTLPSTPVILVAATETLGYVGYPNTIPIIVNTTLVLDTLAGIYANVDSDAALVIGLGTDWSLNLSNRSASEVFTNAGVNYVNLYYVFQSSVAKAPSIVEAKSVYNNFNGNMEDNGLVIAANNASAGNFTGGNAANNLKVSIVYTIYNYTTGQYQ